jgi:hypothetical protein
MTSQRIRSGMKVHRYAEEHIQMLTTAGQELRTMPQVAKMLDGYSKGVPYHWSYQDHIKFSKDTLTRVGDLIAEVAICDMWKRNGRVAYDMNEELTAALYRSRMEAIPGSVFERLPHINPMVVLPDPWPVEDPSSGTTGWVRGWFLFGWVGDALCDTNAPEREGLGVMYFYDIVDQETGEMTPGPNRMVIPLPTGRAKITIKDAIQFVEEWHHVDERAMDIGLSEKILAPLLRPTFSVMTYLCCDNRDVQEPVQNERRRKKTGKGRQEPRAPFWVRVGWYVGPALHEARRRANSADRSSVSIPSGVEYGPQHRAGHFKTVHHGPRKSQESTKWVEPYWTKREMLEPGQDPVTVVVPVNPQRYDPLRRRGLR